MAAKPNSRRLETLLNKGYQLHKLCDIDVCVVCIDPVSGQISTWPKDKSDVVRIIQRYRSCSSKKRSFSSGKTDTAKKRRKVSSDPQSSVSVASDAIPRICYYENPLPAIDQFDLSDLVIPEYWYSENTDGLGSEIGSDGFDQQPELGVMGFGINIEPPCDEMTDQLEALNSMIHRIDEALEKPLLKKEQEEVEVKVEERQSEATQIDLDFDFDFAELPQLDDPYFTPNCCDCNSFDLESFDFWSSM